MWLIEAGDFASAEPLVRGALEMRRKLLGRSIRDVAGSMTLLAGLLVETGRYEEALALASGRKASGSRRLPRITGARPAPRRPKGAALAGLQRFDEAEKLLLTSYKVLHDDRGVLKFYTTSSSRWLAKLYQAMGQPGEGGRVRGQAARLGALRERSLGRVGHGGALVDITPAARSGSEGNLRQASLLRAC